MVTKLSKIMVVFIAATSIAFMGFAIALSNSGPNWQTEMLNLPDYAFTQSEGENPTWSARRRTETTDVGTSANLADVIGRAYAAETQRNQALIDPIQPQIDALELNIGSRQVNVETDTKGMEARVAQLYAARETLQQQVKAIVLAATAKGEQATKIREEAERRRGSGFRLRRQMESIETETFQLTEQRRVLLDLYYQMEGLRLRLAEREQQLIREGATATNGSPESVDQNVSFEQDSDR